MSKNASEQLHNNLKNFGLNPKDWRIQEIQNQHYAVTDVQDGQFYFLGEVDTTKESPTWNRLELILF